jgi:hypothetical protein
MGGGMAGPALVAATNKPFGVNLLMPLLQEGQIETCLDERVPFIVLF